MKQMFVAFAVISTLFFTGCKTGSSDPKPVLENFMKALANKDIEGAKKYATAESASILDLTRNMGMGEDSMSEKYDVSKLDIGEARIEGDLATVPVKMKENDVTINYRLKKESGAWKVAFDKGSLMTMGMDAYQNNAGKLNLGDSVGKAMDALKNVPIDSLNAAMQELKELNIDSLKMVMKDGMAESMKVLDSLKKHQ